MAAVVVAAGVDAAADMQVDLAQVVQFNDRATTLQPFTSDLAALEAAIGNPEVRVEPRHALGCVGPDIGLEPERLVRIAEVDRREVAGSKLKEFRGRAVVAAVPAAAMVS